MVERASEHVVTVDRHNGAPALFVDGRVQPFTSFKITETHDLEEMLDAADAEIPGLARRSIRTVWVPVFIDWKGPGQYDFSEMDARVERVLRHLDAGTPPGETPGMIFIRLQAAIFTPAWYVDEFRDATGRPTNLIEFRNTQGRVSGYGETVAISLGDSFWDTHAVDCVRACVRHVRQSGYAGRVIGWLPCAFNTNEWFIHCDRADSTHDFSRPTQEAFAKYLKELRGIDLSDPVPSPHDCIKAYRGEFLETDPTTGPFVEEYAVWSSERMADIILKWARAVREECGPVRKLVGFFYGYQSELSGSPQFQQCAHLALRRLLDSEEIDFFCSPCQYLFRADEGEVTFNSVMGPFADSARLHAKLTFAEDDHRPPRLRTANNCLVTRDEWHDEMFFRRNFGQVMTHGQQLWWYSLGPRWLDEDRRQDVVGRLHALGVEAMARDRSPTAQVAIVFDERSATAMRHNAPFQKSLIMQTYGGSFQAVGAPVEFHELHSFLNHADPQPYRFIVFLNLFLLDEDTRDAVNRLKSANRTLFFQYAPGFATGRPGNRTFSAESASDLVGMRLTEVEEPMPLTVWIDPDSHPFFAECDDIRYGFKNPFVPVGPVLAAVDADAEELGRLYNGRAGLAVKDHGDWSAVFSAAPEIPPVAVQRLLKRAGVHLYTESRDVVYANRSYLVFSACSRGVKRIVLPEPRKVTDALTGEPVALDKDNAATLSMRRHEVRIFRLD